MSSEFCIEGQLKTDPKGILGLGIVVLLFVLTALITSFARELIVIVLFFV